ncbi:hypothetical protein LWI28_021452 [Acer negundo]|uniref:RING-type domain-containing protein n=1 Tax=Acer negundo TaxID=4023 RepID=A0AAD5INH0_ACENE|nr:hypothetical protein LWI28_021452 [Acer negundo]KAK4841648.1 hypothetical protein QYF36_008098 [Acer negundo]
MGLSNFPGAAEGVLPLLVMNTVLYVALLKKMVRSVLQVIGCATWSITSSSSTGLSSVEEGNLDIFYSNSSESSGSSSSREIRRRGVSITQFKSLCKDQTAATMECCVCLSGFQVDEEVSELSCKHFFHKGCLDKWFDNNHTTCPLCRSVL